MRLAGSIYEGRSPAGQRALAGLRAAFQSAGFYAEKERWTEGSLRVYPERRGWYPLLNPRLAGARGQSPVTISGPSMVCPVYSTGDRAIGRALSRLSARAGWSFQPEPRPHHSGIYERHGFLIAPLRLIGGARSAEIDWSALHAPLSDLHFQLTRSLYLGG